MSKTLRTTTYATLFALALGSLNFSSGPTNSAGDRTGSPVADGTCSSCHNGGDFGTETEIELLTSDNDGTVVEEYMPGVEYLVRINVATDTDPAAYGFQAVILDAGNNSVGTYGAAPDDARFSMDDGRTYVEHTQRRETSEVLIPWTAPEAGTGTVTVFAAGNAVNGNGGNSGDEVNLAQLELVEAATSSARELLTAEAWRAYAVQGELYVDLFDRADNEPLVLRVYDAVGRTVVEADLNGSQFRGALDLAPQMLSVQVSDREGRRSSTRRLIWR